MGNKAKSNLKKPFSTHIIPANYFFCLRRSLSRLAPSKSRSHSFYHFYFGHILGVVSLSQGNIRLIFLAVQNFRDRICLIPFLSLCRIIYLICFIYIIYFCIAWAVWGVRISARGKRGGGIGFPPDRPNEKSDFGRFALATGACVKIVDISLFLYQISQFN